MHIDKDVEPLEEDRVHAEEVRRNQRLGMGGEKLLQLSSDRRSEFRTPTASSTERIVVAATRWPSFKISPRIRK